jgi:hypothetical protein
MGKLKVDKAKLINATKWLKKAKSKTLVHALVHCEAGLKEFVDQSLKEGKFPVAISNELHKKMDGRFDSYKIPSHNSITNYRDKYFSKSEAVANLVASNSPKMKAMLARIQEGFDPYVYYVDFVIDLHSEVKKSYDLMKNQTITIDMYIKTKQLLKDSLSDLVDIEIKLGYRRETPKELKVTFAKENQFGQLERGDIIEGEEITDPEQLKQRINDTAKQISDTLNELEEYKKYSKKTVSKG